MFANGNVEAETRNNTENLNSRRKFLKCALPHTITRTKCNEIRATTEAQFNNCSLSFERDGSRNNPKSTIYVKYFNEVSIEFPLQPESTFFVLQM